MATRRAWPVFVAFSIVPPGMAAMARWISNVASSKSMSSHRRPHASPRRQPVHAIRASSAPKSGSSTNAFETSARTSSDRGGLGGRSPSGGSSTPTVASVDT